MVFREMLGALAKRFPVDGAPAETPEDEAARLRAKEAADHKAWLRENAESVVVPEHPAVAVLRAIEWGGANEMVRDGEAGAEPCCPSCRADAWNLGTRGTHAPGCALDAVLAGKPGDRILAELLAEAEERGAQAAELRASHKAAEVFRATCEEVEKKITAARAEGARAEREACLAEVEKQAREAQTIGEALRCTKTIRTIRARDVDPPQPDLESNTDREVKP